MKGEVRHFRDGDIIFQEDEVGTEIFVLEQGQIDLIKQAGRSSLQLASLVQEGELFGEMAAFDQAGRRSATARAHGDVRVSVVPKDVFFAELERDPELSFAVMSKLVKRLRDTDDMLAAQAAGNQTAADNRAKRPSLAPAPGDEKAEAPAPEPPAKEAGKGGFFARLFGGGPAKTSRAKPMAAPSPEQKTAPTAPALPTVSGPPSKELMRAFEERHAILAALLADIDGDNGDIKGRLLGALSGHDGFLPIPLLESVTPSDQKWPEPRLIESGQRAAKLIRRASRGNVLLWGYVEPGGQTVRLHFFPAAVEGELRPGGITQFFSFPIPVAFGEETGKLIAAVTLAGALPRTDAHVAVIAGLVPPTFSEAKMLGCFDGLAGEQAAGLMTAFGDVMACIGFFATGPERLEEALIAYRAALDLISRRDDAFGWAMLKRQMGTVYLALEERKRGSHGADLAVQELTEAMEVLTPDSAPWNRAAAQDRLGVAYYKLGAPDCDAPVLQRALDSFQAASKVFSESTSPQRWAEVQHNLGLLLQLLGAQFHRQDILKWAVDSCRSALKVRKREEVPLLWANTQNTLGAALFLLFKEVEEDMLFVEAQQALQSAKDIYEAFGLYNKAKVAEVNLMRLENYVDSRAQASDGDDGSEWFLEEEDDVVKS